MKKLFSISILLLTLGLLCQESFAQTSAGRLWHYRYFKMRQLFKDAVYNDSSKQITFRDSTTLSGIRHDSTLTGSGEADSLLSVARALPPFVVADSLKHVRINAAGTGIEYATASSGGGKQNICARTPSIDQAATRYNALNCVSSESNTIMGDPSAGIGDLANAYTFSVAGTLKNMRIQANSAPNVGQTVTVTVMKNGVATTMTATLTDASALANDLTNTVSFAAGDLAAIKYVTSAASGFFRASISWEFVPN